MFVASYYENAGECRQQGVMVVALGSLQPGGRRRSGSGICATDALTGCIKELRGEAVFLATPTC